METGCNTPTDKLQHSVSRCCFQVSLVPKITQILHLTVPDTFLTC